MKLIFDQNLSPNLTNRLADIFTGLLHVHEVGLERSLDIAIWQYASEHDYIIVTKDVDFSERSSIVGFPPKIIWVRRGNCSTNEIENILRLHSDEIILFDAKDDVGILELY